MRHRHWDLFCRVIDNYGDVGTGWRLASDLAARGAAVRLVIDDASALAWLAPGGAPGVDVRPWPEPGPTDIDAAAAGAAARDTAGAAAAVAVADVVVETLGCDPPADYVRAMSSRPVAPAWFNVEHLSAERWVERCHGLPSPQPGGLVKRFHFPGFSAATGGLIREPGLLDRRAAFDRDAWLAARGIPWRSGERLVGLFCYDDTAAIAPLLTDLAREPTLLIATPGAATRQTVVVPPGRLRVHPIDWLSQSDYDRLLWSCDVNFVRGEDSLVRAIWAGAPFVWQAYRQHDGAHHAKVQALLDTLAAAVAAGGDGRAAATVEAIGAAWRAWNGGATSWPGLPPLDPWRRAVDALRTRLLALPDLTTTLVDAAERELAPARAGTGHPSAPGS